MIIQIENADGQYEVHINIISYTAAIAGKYTGHPDTWQEDIPPCIEWEILECKAIDDAPTLHCLRLELNNTTDEEDEQIMLYLIRSLESYLRLENKNG